MEVRHTNVIVYVVCQLFSVTQVQNHWLQYGIARWHETFPARKALLNKRAQHCVVDNQCVVSFSVLCTKEMKALSDNRNETKCVEVLLKRPQVKWSLTGRKLAASNGKQYLDA
jgi:hypothetical protein